MIQTKKTLSLAETGREVLDRKRDILMRELRVNIYNVEKLRGDLLEALTKAYRSLHEASIAKGPETTANVALGSSYEADFLLEFRSIMGVTIPIIKFKAETNVKPDYGFANTSAELDMAFKQFYAVLELIADLARAEGAAIQLASDVLRTQRRVNALNHVLIPKYRDLANYIELVLEEKDLEEFVRTKWIKNSIEESKSQ